MSVMQTELEIVDRATRSIRYLEHGWPTDLCRWHAHEEYELHLITAHNWITDEVWKEPVETRDMLVQFSHESIEQLANGFPEFGEVRNMLSLAQSGILFEGFNPTFARGHFESIRDNQGPERILAFIRFLVRLNEPVSQAAEMAGMTQATFSRNFQTVTGHKFVEFVNRVRIGQACGMLYASDESITTICYQSGYQNLANFNRHFLKMKGMTPSSYRETARKDLVRKMEPTS